MTLRPGAVFRLPQKAMPLLGVLVPTKNRNSLGLTTARAVLLILLGSSDEPMSLAVGTLCRRTEQAYTLTPAGQWQLQSELSQMNELLQAANTTQCWPWIPK